MLTVAAETMSLVRSHGQGRSSSVDSGRQGDHFASLIDSNVASADSPASSQPAKPKVDADGQRPAASTSAAPPQNANGATGVAATAETDFLALTVTPDAVEQTVAKATGDAAGVAASAKDVEKKDLRPADGDIAATAPDATATALIVPQQGRVVADMPATAESKSNSPTNEAASLMAGADLRARVSQDSAAQPASAPLPAAEPQAGPAADAPSGSAPPPATPADIAPDAGQQVQKATQQIAPSSLAPAGLQGFGGASQQPALAAQTNSAAALAAASDPDKALAPASVSPAKTSSETKSPGATSTGAKANNVGTLAAGSGGDDDMATATGFGTTLTAAPTTQISAQPDDPLPTPQTFAAHSSENRKDAEADVSPQSLLASRQNLQSRLASHALTMDAVPALPLTTTLQPAHFAFSDAAALQTAGLSVSPAADAPVPVSALGVELAANLKNGRSSFEIRLDPADLGRIDVRMDIDRNGHVTSHLAVERPATLELLQRDASQLARALHDAGLKTSGDGLQFSLRDQSSGRNNDSGSNRWSQRLVISDDETAQRESAGRNYGRLSGLTGGLDIRV